MTTPPEGPDRPIPLTDRSDAGNVVSLGAHRAARMTPAIAQIESYWQGLRDGRLVPERSEIDPRGLTGALEYAFVLERIAPGLARFRVAGRHMNDLMGMETRAMPISAVFLPDSRRELAQALDAVFDEPATVRLDLGADGGFGRSALSGQMILLPVRSESGTVDRSSAGWRCRERSAAARAA